jgi:hypothetical protein
VEEPLRDTGKAQELQRAAMSVDHASKTADGIVEHPTPTPTSSRDRDEHEGLAGAGSVHPHGDGSVSNERGG